MRTLDSNEIDAVSGGASMAEGAAVAVGGAIVGIIAAPLIGGAVVLAGTIGFLGAAFGYGYGWASSD